MSDIAAITDYDPDTIQVFSYNCLGMGFVTTGELFTGQAAWSTANTAMFIPFRIANFMKLQKVFWYNGTASTDSVDFGIFDTQGNKLGSIGGTAVSGSSNRQEVSLSLALSPGLYFMGFVCNGTTATFQRSVINAGISRGYGILQAATSYPLPSSVTYAANTLTTVPYIGITVNPT